MPAADRRVHLHLEAIDRSNQLLAVAGRRLDQIRRSGERHDTDAHIVGLRLHECLRGFLRCGHPVRQHVLRAHRKRHVDREHDRALMRRERDLRERARTRDDCKRQRNQKQCGRDMPADARTRPECLAHEREVRMAYGEFLPAAKQQHVAGDQCRHEQQERKRFDPDECHVHGEHGDGRARPRCSSGRGRPAHPSPSNHSNTTAA